jgi:hypothetical protein
MYTLQIRLFRAAVLEVFSSPSGHTREPLKLFLDYSSFRERRIMLIFRAGFLFFFFFLRLNFSFVMIGHRNTKNLNSAQKTFARERHFPPCLTSRTPFQTSSSPERVSFFPYRNAFLFQVNISKANVYYSLYYSSYEDHKIYDLIFPTVFSNSYR